MKKKLSKLAAALMIAGFMFAGVCVSQANGNRLNGNGPIEGWCVITTCMGIICDQSFADVHAAVAFSDFMEDVICPALTGEHLGGFGGPW